jgi:MFS family permease
MLALLRRRDLGLLWLGGLVSVAGDYVLYAALPYFVYRETGSTVATAGMIAASLAPGVVLGSFAGVLVDRWDRKRLLVASNVLQAAAVALLLLVPAAGALWLVYVVAAAQSVLATLSQPAESALLPRLVPEEHLVAANSLNALNNRLGRLLGLPVGGALLGAFGLAPVVLVDCATFLAAAALITPIRTPPAARGDDDVDAAVAADAFARFWREWLDGLALIRRERALVVLFAVLGLMTYGGTMVDPLHPAWVRDALGGGPAVFSLLLTTGAAGGIAGTLLVGRIGDRLGPRELMGWSSVFAGAMLLLKWNVPSLPLALTVSALVGMTAVASSVGVQTLAQRSVRDEQRGRVFGSLGASGALLSLAGAGTGGALAAVVGTVTMLNVASMLVLISGVFVLRAFARPQPAAATAPARQVRPRG